MYFLGYRKALAARRTVVVNDESRPGIQRFYTEDPWSNRIELVDAERPRASSLSPGWTLYVSDRLPFRVREVLASAQRHYR